MYRFAFTLLLLASIAHAGPRRVKDWSHDPAALGQPGATVWAAIDRVSPDPEVRCKYAPNEAEKAECVGLQREIDALQSAKAARSQRTEELAKNPKTVRLVKSALLCALQRAENASVKHIEDQRDVARAAPEETGSVTREVRRTRFRLVDIAAKIENLKDEMKKEKIRPMSCSDATVKVAAECAFYGDEKACGKPKLDPYRDLLFAARID